ncbi:hypothetical protein ACWX0K_15330 [Nitrobacteraceae bacterium UC4446_H13]
MARKHQPLVIGGIEVEITGQGFRLIDRPGGADAYWYAAKRAVKKGFHPSTVRLHGNLSSYGDVKAMFDRCNALWSEMLDWIAAGENDRRPVYDGTVGSLIKCYQTDPESTFHDLRFNTQRGYLSWFTALDKIAGTRRVSALAGTDLRGWYRETRKPARAGEAPRERLAKAVMQAMRIVLVYGRELGLADCIDLLAKVEGMEFRRENDEKRLGKPKPKPKVVMTYGQAEAIVRKGLELGTHRGRSVALAVAAQFEFTISQIDAIGYWMPVRAVVVEPDMIVRGGKVWRPGLRFEDFESGVLDLARLKTGKRAQFDVAEYPLFQLALSAMPEGQRHGPFVTDDDGDPVRYRVFYGMYRAVADAAGVPKDVWNARARHGGGTEARASGATIEDTTDHMQKTDMEGTRRDYIGGNVETTRRVARKRVARRAAVKAAG